MLPKNGSKHLVEVKDPVISGLEVDKNGFAGVCFNAYLGHKGGLGLPAAGGNEGDVFVGCRGNSVQMPGYEEVRYFFYDKVIFAGVRDVKR